MKKIMMLITSIICSLTAVVSASEKKEISKYESMKSDGNIKEILSAPGRVCGEDGMGHGSKK